jgi:hypothetical protein
VPDYTVRVRPNSGWAILVGMVAVGVIAVAGFRSAPESPAGSGSTTATLQVVPTMRTVIVSPGTTKFGRCYGGKYGLRSTGKALGFPNGHCSIGSRKKRVFPIKIANGREAEIYVKSSAAVPADGKTEWKLCNRGSAPVVACKGPNDNPAKDQFIVQNFSKRGLNETGLTRSRTCDAEFGQSKDCLAATGETEREGIRLIGPHWPDDPSTTWTVTITWLVAPPP